MENYIAYVRTSTGRQLLGLEEQQMRIHQYIQYTFHQVHEYVFSHLWH